MRRAAGLMKRLDDVTDQLNELDKALGEKGKTVDLCVVENEGTNEGTHYGSVAMPVREMHDIFKGIRSQLVQQLRKLGVDALAD